jgi:hypothetical protein
MGFALNVGRDRMPALFAYLFAVSLLLGGGYMSLHWLSAPPDISSSQRLSPSKRPTANKDMAEKSDPDVAGATRAESRSHASAETERIPSNPTSEGTNNAATKAPRTGTAANEDNTMVLTKQAEDVPPGGCTPIGLTAQGQLVFPMQCQGLLERHRGPVAPQDHVPTNSISASAPKEGRAAGPARPGDDEEQAENNKPNAKVEDGSPSGQAKPGNGNSQPEAIKEKTMGRQDIQPLHSRNEKQWFNPLTFR